MGVTETSDSLRVGRSGDRIPGGRNFSHPSRQVSGSTHPSVNWIPVSFPGLKRPGRVPSSPSNAEVKGYSYTSPPPPGLHGLF